MSQHPHAAAEHPHPSLKSYFGVFIFLLVGTWFTVFIAKQDLGALNTPMALGVAVCKATAVILIFMHVKYSSKLVWVFAGAGFFWLVLLFTFVFPDYVSRDWMPVYGNNPALYGKPTKDLSFRPTPQAPSHEAPGHEAPAEH